MKAVLAIGAVELRRFVADRSNIFFVFIFPLVLVLVLGVSFGGQGSAGRVVIAGADSTLRTALVDQLESARVEVTFADAPDMRDRVAQGNVDVGVLIPPDAGAAYEAGQDASIEVVPGSQANGQASLQLVREAAAGVASHTGQVAALEAAGAPASDIDAALTAAGKKVKPATIQVQDTNAIAQKFEGLGRFDQGASSQLLLFVFLASLAGSTTLIVARRNGVIKRTLAAPVRPAQAVLGQTLGRLVIALFQGVYIMVATAVLFGVNWGNLWLSGLILLVFGLVSAGAALLLGVLFDNEGAATGAGIGLGLILAAIGGCMVPLELFSDTLQTVAHFTPHAWAYEALGEVQRHQASLLDIAPQLGVLLAMAVVALALGAWALRRSLARAM